jgi:hypothetical protein
MRFWLMQPWTTDPRNQHAHDRIESTLSNHRDQDEPEVEASRQPKPPVSVAASKGSDDDDDDQSHPLVYFAARL